MNKTQRSILYKKYLEGTEKANEQKEISEKLGVETGKVVVKKVSTFAKIIEITEDVFFQIIKILFYIAICLLASIGITVLLNGEMREMLVQLITNTFS